MIIDRGKPCDSWASPDCRFFVAPFSTLYPSARTKPLLFFSSGHLSCKVPGCTMLYISWWLGERRQRLFTVTMTLWLNWWHNQRRQDLNCTITDSNGVLRHYAPSATPPFARKARKCGSKPYKQFWKNEKPLGREIKWCKWSGQRIISQPIWSIISFMHFVAPSIGPVEIQGLVPWISQNRLPYYCLTVGELTSLTSCSTLSGPE